MLKFTIFGHGMKNGVFKFFVMARNLGQAWALETVFLCYIASQKATMFIGFSGRKDIKSILPH